MGNIGKMVSAVRLRLQILKNSPWTIWNEFRRSSVYRLWRSGKDW